MSRDSDIFYGIADKVAKVAAGAEAKKAFDAAPIVLSSYLIGTALSGLQSLRAVSQAIDVLVRKTFDTEYIESLEPKEAGRLLERALDLWKVSFDGARQVSKEVEIEKLKGLLEDVRLYEEAGADLDNEIIKEIAEEVAARLDSETFERIKSMAKKKRRGANSRKSTSATKKDR